MRTTEEAQTFYTNMNTFTEAVTDGTTDLEKIITFIMNYKEALKTETIQRAESLAEKYLTDIVPDMLIILDMVRADWHEEFKDNPTEED